MSFVGDFVDDITGKTAAKEASAASAQASSVAAASEREKLDYLKEINALPQQLKEQALQQLGGAFGLEGYGDVDLTQQAMNNPLYQAQMGNIGDMTQQAIDTSMSTASATGGLRGGNLQRGFGEIAERQKLAENQALGNSYQQQLSGLGGLAGLNTGSDNIANTMGNIGNIQAQGIIGGQQSANAARQAGIGNTLGLGGLGVGIAGLFSDRRLKTNIKKIGEENGFTLYKWDWNEAANDIGLTGGSTGHMADEVELVYPDLVNVDDKTGYKQVNYGALKNG